MKFLCLHGSYGSATNFQAQLNNLAQELEKLHQCEFRWIDGLYPTEPPKGFSNYFGAPPLYNFTQHDDAESRDSFVDRLRQFPVGKSPEDSLRLFFKDQNLYASASVQRTIENLKDTISSDPEIQGILGYSEGAMIAASLIVEERRNFEKAEVPRKIKFGVFFAGWPPVRLEGGQIKCLLPGECDDIIDIPTCHIVGIGQTVRCSQQAESAGGRIRAGTI
ncbi:serine hydrolase (FSH1) domain-containing protein [Hirsutella rhossiliensis]|uniref:Serine hydrolase (FSH1) domain-containing protein n=1 Tax=Hirsutella rhossiliensis TaxID=111463 RepID=A0A9P8N4Q1_9HYPO|nr:serine hydrolase (FSH1) domain-containing protein [Hirsutella rhossiliensis]KAH0967573.1 serine hydrolase (FSH1) domain-containing protein [Hirsutella rhossiliensis]